MLLLNYNGSGSSFKIMSTRKSTLRKLSPDERKIVRIADEVMSAGRRLKNLIKTIHDRPYENLLNDRMIKKEKEYIE